MSLEQVIYDALAPVVDVINKGLDTLLPGRGIFLVIGVSLVLGYFFKRKYNMKYFGFILITFLWYVFFRWLKIGGG